MCTKTPKAQQPKDKPVQYLRNPFLDGLAIGSGQGRDSLRIDRVSSAGSSGKGGGDFVNRIPTPKNPQVQSGLSVPRISGGSGGKGRNTIQKY